MDEKQCEEERKSQATRAYPEHGVKHALSEPTIVFITVCTKDRVPWLARPDYHEMLRDAWSKATAWLVGRYVIMPDHVHLFASPGEPDFELGSWTRYWKSNVSRRHRVNARRWQKDFWDTRMRSQKRYEEKWDYVQDNPVRAGLVTRADEWPYQGEIHELKW